MKSIHDCAIPETAPSAKQPGLHMSSPLSHLLRSETARAHHAIEARLGLDACGALHPGIASYVVEGSVGTFQALGDWMALDNCA